MACHRLFRHPGLHALVLERCAAWGLDRQRIPSEFMETVRDDLEKLAAKQIDVRVCALLNKPDAKPKERPPRKPKPPGKRTLQQHPTLAL